MRLDLLRGITEEEEITNAIVLTHNIDFVFLQTVVVSALKRCGHPTLTVLADAECAASAYAYQAPLLHGLGVRYRVVPIEMARGFRFHPKALLLSGTDYATLSIGSGNLTFGGWRENAEVWLRFDTRSDGTGPFSAFRRYLYSVLDRVALSEPVRAEIEEGFDPATRGWAVGLAEPTALLGKVSGEPPLLDQMLAVLGGVSVDRLTVCTPYFDAEAEALSQLVQRVAPTPVTVLVQSGRTGLSESAWAGVGQGAELLGVRFHRQDDERHPRDAFIHAKFYAFEHGERVTVVLGSANCSRAALTIPGKAGNAELLAVRVMEAAEYRALISELVSEAEAPRLTTKTTEPATASIGGLRILGASYEGSNLRVAYGPREWRITECHLDGATTPFETLGPGLILVQVDRPPRHVSVVGSDGEASAHSAHGWIDNEWELRSTARSRSVGEGFRTRVRPEEWGIGAWTDVLDIFCAHLRYLPPSLPPTEGGGSPGKGRERSALAYSAKDVFASGYDLPSLSALLPPLAGSPDGRVRSLQELLLRWFRLPSQETEDDTEQDEDAPAGDDEAVDRPEQFPRKPQRRPAAEPTDRDRRRVERLVARLSDAMTDVAFLEGRPPELLAADIRVSSILLRVALSEGWLDALPFFKATHRVWSSLFFDANGTNCHLQRRYERAGSAEDFAAALSSPDVLAALAAWALGVPPGAPTAEHARFGLTTALAIARLPWLWDQADDRQVCRELAELLAHTTRASDRVSDIIDIIGDRWLQLVQRGHALRRLEGAVVGKTAADLCSRVIQRQLEVGELLWQGSAGFCVVTRPADRSAGVKVRGLRLQGTQDESDFAAHLTVPVAALLTEQVVPATDAFGPGPRDVLRGFLRELASGFSRGAGSDARPRRRKT